MKRALATALTGQARLLSEGSRALADARRVAAFLAGRVAFEPRPDDVFIATYPRSGTTLMQWIVLLLAEGGTPPEAEHLNDVSPWFERGLATGVLTPERIAALSSPRIFKTHLTAEWVPRGPRIVGVVRDSRDVATSYYHFHRSYLGFEGSFDAFFDRFVEGRVQYGSWFSHVAGWRARQGEGDVLLLRYEDLLDDREAQIRAVAGFLGWPADDSLIARVAEATSFAAMKEREAFFDHATALLLERGVRGESFIRSGKRGEGEAMDAHKLRLLEARERDARPDRAIWLPAFLQ